MEETNDFIKSEVETIFTSFLSLTNHMSIDYIKPYVFNIEDKINSDFLVIQKYAQEKEIKIFRSQFKIYLYSLIGLRKKSFYKVLELKNALEIEQEDFESYLEHFRWLEEETKNKIIHIFNTYFQIIQEYSEKKEAGLKEFYTIYQAIEISMLYLLPKNYRQNLLEQENFKDLKQEIRMMNCEEKLGNANLGQYFISCLEDYIRKYILAKYGIDLFEFHESRERKRI